MNSIELDGEASKACMWNNFEQVSKNKDEPDKLGNIKKYAELTGKQVNYCDESTTINFQGGDDAEYFVALQMALDYEGMNNNHIKYMQPSDNIASINESRVAEIGT